MLSGADGDGAIGIKRIKERGGLTIAQDPDEAEHGGMPRAAIATGMVDWVLPVAAMPDRLVRLPGASSRKLRLPAEDGLLPASADARPADDLEAALRELLAYLRAQTGRDFSYYKRATILRRIARRMSVNGIEELPGYLSFMRTHPGEAGALLKDLLISVTNFFRDREAFDALAAQIPALFAGKSSERRGARLGAGLRDRRGGVLDRDAARRACAHAGGAAVAADLRERPRRGRDPAGARGRLSVGDHGRRLGRPPAPLLHQGASRLPGAREICARPCCSPCTTC